MDDVGFLEALFDAAELAVDIDIDVVVKGDAPVVQDGRPRRHGGFRIEYGGKQLVVDLEQAAGRFGSALGFRHDGRDPLPDEADDIVEDVGVVGIDEVILVGSRAVEPAGDVLPSEYGDNAGHRRGLVALDGLDARVRMRRAQHFEMQHVHRRHVERVARVTGYDRLGERTARLAPQACPATSSSTDLMPCEGVDDALIAGAAAEVALEHARQVPARRLVEGGGRHDHAGGAEAALERLRIEKRLLHGMQPAVLLKPSIVVISRPAARNAGIRQLWNGVPSSQTVQAPQSPASQPFLTPKHPCSRRKVRRHWPVPAPPRCSCH